MSNQFLAQCIGAANAANANEQYAIAVDWCQRAIRLQSKLPEAWYNLGIAYSGLGQREQSLSALKKTETLTRDNPDAQNSVGFQLLKLGALGEAERCLLRAIFVAPGFAYAHSNLGMLREKQGRLEDAEASFRKAIALQPDLAPVYVNLSSVLSRRKRHEFAEAAARRAIEIDPRSSDAWSCLGLVLVAQKRHKDAVDCFSSSLKLNAQAEYVLGDLMHSQMHICEWGDFDGELAELARQFAKDRKVINPFSILALTDDLAMHRKAAETFSRCLCPDAALAGPIAKIPRHDRVRIGYYSADYFNHATSYLIAEMLELHDKSKFELIGFSFGPNLQDEMRQRVSSVFDRFIDVSERSDRDVALLSRDMGIDIAIDLKGYTQDSRPGIFAFRAAPVQVNYLGFPGTMGADFIDYIIADRMLIPSESQSHYSEKIIYLPNSYQVNDTKRQISPRAFARDELGLPASGFVFACFNNTYKITPKTFAGWMRILGKVADSVLWLFESNPDAVVNLRKEAEVHGVNARRLVFASQMPLNEHLARIAMADLFLDTFPCNAHTTTSDALWVGLPVLTCMGESFASRVAGSLLNAMGLPELIADSQQAYEDLAVEFATSPDRIAAIKQKLARNRDTTPLFDSSLFTGHIEAAYLAIYERYLAGSLPENIYIGQYDPLLAP